MDLKLSPEDSGGDEVIPADADADAKLEQRVTAAKIAQAATRSAAAETEAEAELESKAGAKLPATLVIQEPPSPSPSGEKEAPAAAADNDNRSNDNHKDHSDDHSDDHRDDHGQAASDFFVLGLPLIREIDDARQYPRRIKHLITGLAAFCGLSTPLGSNIMMAVLAPAGRDLHTTPTVMNLSIALYCLAVAFTPMWWAILSESQGTRRTYMASFLLFIVFNVLAAVSRSPAMFMVMRLLVGATSAPVQALGAATVADLWELKERSRAMGIFLLGALSGNVVGPIVGAALGSRWNWRSTQWFMVIYGGVIWLTVVLFFPETRTGALKRRRETRRLEKKKSREQGRGKHGHVVAVAFKKSIRGAFVALVKPASLLPLLRFPPILITVVYTAINFAAYYYTMIAIQATYSAKPYSYSVIIVGCLYFPNAVGNLIAATLGARWTERIMRRKAAAAERYDAGGHLKPKPQDALGINIWLAGLVYPLAMLVFGWTAHEHVTAAPLVMNFFFAVGNTMLQNFTTVLLTEFVPGRAAAGVALANLVRNTLGAVVCIVEQPLIDAIGLGWLTTIAGLVCLSCTAFLFLLQRNADRWSKRMAEQIPQL